MLDPPLLGLLASFTLSPSAGFTAVSLSSILYDRPPVSAVESIVELPFDVASDPCWSFSRASFSCKVDNDVNDSMAFWKSIAQLLTFESDLYFPASQRLPRGQSAPVQLGEAA